jgi:DNA-binding Lrp family transcriptional regulator
MLDKKDNLILAMLARNARTPMTEMAKRLGISNTATKKRIGRLEKNGIIRGYRADVDFQSIGKEDYMILVNVPSAGASSIQRILADCDIAIFRANNFDRTMFYAFVGEDIKDKVMEGLRKAGLECLAVKVSRVL